MPQDSSKIYLYDTSRKGSTPESKLFTGIPTTSKYTQPSLETIQGWLQTPLGVSKPSSLLSLNARGRLNYLSVDNIYSASLDGGDF